MAVVQDRNSSRAGRRRSTLTWVLLLLEVAVVVSQSLSCVSWVLATIHSFTVVTLGPRLQENLLFYGVCLE